jgi:predicted  nucleic acid-binding Zn-ribbon protein
MTDSATPPPNGEQSVDTNKLLRALIELFNEQELRDLCFELRLDYENLEGSAKKDKARELINYFFRRRRLNVLLTVFREHRPHITVEDLLLQEGEPDPSSTIVGMPTTLPSSPKDMSNTMLVSKSFVTMLRLLTRPDMRAAVVAFQTDFQAASSQIDQMNDFKLAHDLFQELENRYFLIQNDERRLPADDLAWDSIAINEPELQGKISDLRVVTQRPTFANDEARWMAQLDKVSESIRIGVEQFDLEELKRGTSLLYRVLNRTPSRINAQLVSTATALRLDALEQAMQTINTNLSGTEAGMDSVVEEIANGVAALSGLDERLKVLVKEHNAWQEIDDELRRVEASLNQSIDELDDAWFDLEPMARDLAAGQDTEWTAELNDVVDKLDEALRDKVVVTVRRLFRRFQSQVRRRFRQVDLELLTLCQDLQRVGESLDLLLRQFEK